MTVEMTVPDALDGERVDRVVAMLTGASRSEVSRWLADGLVRLDGQPAASRSVRVVAGARGDLDVDLDAGPVALAGEPDVEVPVVYSDDDVLVVDKPAGLVVHPGSGNATGTLVQGLLARYPEIAGVGDPARPGIVHRLDKDTSGVLLVARTQLAYEQLTAALAAHEVERVYRTLVWGHPSSTSGMVDAPIGRSQRDPTRMAVSTQGREARTRYEVEHTYSEPTDVAELTCRLETGRTHQIRVHLAAIGHPVVGDRRYGGYRSSLEVPRTVLHATALRLDHPTRPGSRIEIDAPLPADLVGVFAALAPHRPTV
jgi:23S rRNA pseudouridine1911/1915/1917 synthase